MRLTSYPNQTPSDYIARSCDEQIYADFPIDVGAFALVNVRGKQYGKTLYIESANDWKVISSWKWSDRFARYRLDLMREIIQYYPKSSPWILSLVFGNRRYLSSDLSTKIRYTGVSYLFALSGLHVVIVMALLLGLLNYTNLSYQYPLIISIPMVLLYLFIGGIEISLQRAVLSYVLWSFFQLLRLPLSNKKNLFLCLIINLLIFPSNIESLSFVLSYFALLGIVFFYQICYDVSISIFKKGSSYIAMSLSAQIFVVPIIIYSFAHINIFSIGYSMLLLPLIVVVMILSFLATLTTMVHINGSALFAPLLNIVQNLIEFILDFSLHIPKTVWIFRYRELAIIIYFVILIIAWRMYVGREKINTTV